MKNLSASTEREGSDRSLPAKHGQQLASIAVARDSGPLTPEIRAAISEAELRRLAPSGILIDTARAEIVDLNALVSSLEAGELSGAGIDVFAEGPPSREHPLLEYETLALTPHIGGQTTEALTAMSRRSANNVRSVYDGTMPEPTLHSEELPSALS